MMKHRRWLVIPLLLLLGTAAAAVMLLAAEGATPPASLLVLAKTDRTLSIVDPASMSVIARLPSGPDPHEVIASADGRYASSPTTAGAASTTRFPWWTW